MDSLHEGPGGQAEEITTNLTVREGGKGNGRGPLYALEGQPRKGCEGTFSIFGVEAPRLKNHREIIEWLN
jgi:hypothetical protein